MLKGRETSRSSWWWLTWAIAAALIIGLGSLGLLQVLIRPLAVIFLGMTLAATLAPIVSWLVRWLPRTVAVLLVYLVLVLFLAAILFVLLPPLVQQIQQLLDRLPELASRGEQSLERWQRMANGRLQGSLGNLATGVLGRVGSLATSVPAGIANLFAGVTVAIVVSIYWLILSPRINAFLRSLFPAPQAGRVEAVLDEMAGAMGGYLRGSAINSVVVGVATYIGLLIIGVDYPVALAVLSGTFEFIPLLGPIISAVIITIVASLQSLTTGVLAMAYMIGLQQLENHLLVPNIMKSQTSMSPLLTVLALFVGGTAGGFLGALLAIPLAAALRVFALRVVAPAIRRHTGAATAMPDEKSNEHEEEE